MYLKCPEQNKTIEHEGILLLTMFFSFDFKVSCRVTDCDGKKLIENDKKENKHPLKPEHVSKKIPFFSFFWDRWREPVRSNV